MIIEWSIINSIPFSLNIEEYNKYNFKDDRVQWTLNQYLWKVDPNKPLKKVDPNQPLKKVEPNQPLKKVDPNRSKTDKKWESNIYFKNPRKITRAYMVITHAWQYVYSLVYSGFALGGAPLESQLDVKVLINDINRHHIWSLKCSALIYKESIFVQI
jgi:hypothetical protein